MDKIFILPPNEVLPTLSKFIEPENIPIAYGGTLEFEFGKSRPNLDQASKDTLRLDELPTGPIRWDKGVFTLKGTGRTEEEIERFTPSERPVVLEIVEIISVAEGSTALEEK